MKPTLPPLLLAAAWIALTTPSLLCQTATPTPAATAPYIPTMVFDVASVRENKTVDPQTGFTMTGEFVPHTTVLHVVNWSIENLISMAYGLQEHQLVGLPKWPWPALFVIEAKGDSDADARIAALPQDHRWAEQKHMLQALLEDRFQLKAHSETRDGDIYNLVVAKAGPKLSAAGSLSPSASELKAFDSHPVPPIYQKNDGNGYDFIAHGCPMNQLADTLASQFGRPVINKTGLTAKYDFVLKYKGRWDRDRAADDLDPMPPMDRALQEELGLKIEAAKGPIRVLVIDHIEKPSDN